MEYTNVSKTRLSRVLQTKDAISFRDIWWMLIISKVAQMLE